MFSNPKRSEEQKLLAPRSPRTSDVSSARAGYPYSPTANSFSLHSPSLLPIDSVSPGSASPPPPPPDLQSRKGDQLPRSALQGDGAYREERKDTPLDSELSAIQGRVSSAPSLSKSTTYPPVNSPGPEPIFDPYSGDQTSFLVNPSNTASANPDAQADNLISQPPKGKEASDVDMWNQLAKIRVLQSEIARMHVSMEREEFESATKLKSTEKEGGEEEGGSKMGNSQKSNAYTAKMKDEFEARKESIEAVMSKVDALSELVTTFHSLPTPQLNFPHKSGSARNSRSGPSPTSPTQSQPEENDATSPFTLNPSPVGAPVFSDSPTSAPAGLPPR